MDLSDEKKRRIAFHEAGHAWMTWKEGLGLKSVSMEPHRTIQGDNRDSESLDHDIQALSNSVMVEISRPREWHNITDLAYALLASGTLTGEQVLDIGCGMGFFSLGMARMVGPEGRIISLDLQTIMLKILEKRAIKGGISERIETRLVKEGGFPVETPVDFALCFWMVHEVPDQALFLRDKG